MDSVCDLMGAALTDLKRTEVTENPVYVTGRDLTVGSTAGSEARATRQDRRSPAAPET